MDPVTAVGLASAILSLVDIGTKFVKRLTELHEAGDIPVIFNDISTRLPLIITLVVRAQRETDELPPEADKALEDIVRQCFRQINQLNEILNKVRISKGDSWLKKTFKAGVSLAEEGRVERIATSLRDNVQVMTFLNVSPTQKERPEAKRWPSEPPPSYESSTGTFLVPFSRDKQFVGRESHLRSIASSFSVHNRVAISGIGGVGKSQVAIEYCYRYKESNPNAHILWVYAGNIARFYQGYKRIAEALELPGWDDPEQSILELVYSWLSNTTISYLLVIDNADNIEHWWPGKYKSGGSLDDPSKNLSKYLPDGSNSGQVLITTRDERVAGRLAKEASPIPVESMSNEDVRLLFLSKLGGDKSEYNDTDVQRLLVELDHLPLAVSQSAAFIKENRISLTDYTNALHGEDAEEFLHEELDDARRDEESINSVFRTWKLSYDQITQQKPRAADLLSLLAMLDRQSVPRYLLKVPEVTTSLGVLQSFNLVTTRTGSQSFQIHRLVQRFVQLSLRRNNTAQLWREKALACVSRDYPTEIGVAEWPICDALAPHVHVVTNYEYETMEARLDLAHLLCWAADFDIERGMYVQALKRAEESLKIFRQLVSEDDERLAAATWLYGRLCYYQAQSANDIEFAAQLLLNALSISVYPSLNYAESSFELGHLYYDQCNKDKCLEMAKASFTCWEKIEGSNSVRTLDNMHDYALALAMLGHEKEGVAMWQEILEHCPASDASQNAKTIYTYRSMAGIAEFKGDAATAEIFYEKLIMLCKTIYHAEHIHVLDYRLSHAEQIMRQGRLEEAMQSSEAILASYKNNSEWRISASCLETIAECLRLKGCHSNEQKYRLRILELHEKKLGRDNKETIDVAEALADCYLNLSMFSEAKDLYQEILSWRNTALGQTHVDTVRALECHGICQARQGNEAEAEAAYLDAIDRKSPPDARLLDKLCKSLREQGKWESLESWSRQACQLHGPYQSNAYRNLVFALEQQGKMEEASGLRAGSLAIEASSAELPEGGPLPTNPPVRDVRRFGRMIHPRTWSA